MSPLLPLPAIDGVEITTIMDNALDLLAASTPVAKRFLVHRDLFSSHQLRAEHGVSLLITAINQGKRETILFDTGVTPDGALHNLVLLGVDLSGIQAIVLSHGHTDHMQGLGGFLDTLGKRRLPILLHPDALFEPIIPQTVEALQQITPAVIVPAHCTGWRATQRIAQTMPEAYTPNSVGTTFRLVAE